MRLLSSPPGRGSFARLSAVQLRGRIRLRCTMSQLHKSGMRPTATPTIAFDNASLKRVRRQVIVTSTETSSVQGKTVITNRTITSVLPAPSSNLPTPPKEAKTDVGAVVGGVVGGVVGLIVVLVALWLLYRQIKKRRNARALDTIYAETGQGGGGGMDRYSRNIPQLVHEEAYTGAWDPAIPIQREHGLHKHSVPTATQDTPAAYAWPIHASDPNHGQELTFSTQDVRTLTKTDHVNSEIPQMTETYTHYPQSTASYTYAYPDASAPTAPAPAVSQA